MVEKEEEKLKQKKKSPGQGLFIVLVLAFIVILVIVFLINESKSFDLYGFKWEKRKVGELLFYYAYLHVDRADGQAVNYNLYLRNDPREMKLFTDEIKFRKNITFISISPGLEKCEHSGIAVSNLGGFLTGMGLQVKGAVSVSNSSENNYSLNPYVTCKNRPLNTVILIQEGASSIIQKDGDCYIIDVGNCGLMKQTESFIVSMIKQVTKVY